MRKRNMGLRPTDAELEILGVLWGRGASTVREVHDEINRVRPTGYTTVLKLMQIMTEKNLVTRDEKDRAHIYESNVAREETQRRLVGDLLDQVFEGSAANLVMQALSSKKTSQKDLQSIRKLLDELEGEGK